MNRSTAGRLAGLVALSALSLGPVVACGGDDSKTDTGPVTSSTSPTTNVTSPPGAFKTSPSASAGELPSSAPAPTPSG